MNIANRCYIKGYVSYEKEVQLKLTILIVVTEKITKSTSKGLIASCFCLQKVGSV